MRERNKRARIQRILDAARELLRDGDIRTVTLQQIAQRAEVAPGTVFNLIGPRDRLFAALIDQTHEQVAHAIAKGSPDDPLLRTRRIVATLVKIFAADPDVFRQVLRHWPESGTTLRSSPYPLIRQALADAQTAGMMRPDIDADHVAAAILATCVGTLHQWSAAIISDRAFRERCLLGVDLALAAVATDEIRPAMLARLVKEPR